VAEYIERKAAMREIDHVRTLTLAYLQVATISASDVVEVVHGKWEEADDGDGVVCSICREDFCNIYLEVDRFKYCPNCGAKMDGECNGD
jgi:hypothetical protein